MAPFAREIEKGAIDFGIVTTNGDGMVEYYLEPLGLREAYKQPFLKY